jgi:hypothetical protein
MADLALTCAPELEQRFVLPFVAESANRGFAVGVVDVPGRPECAAAADRREASEGDSAAAKTGNALPAMKVQRIPCGSPHVKVDAPPRHPCDDQAVRGARFRVECDWIRFRNPITDAEDVGRTLFVNVLVRNNVRKRQKAAKQTIEFQIVQVRKAFCGMAEGRWEASRCRSRGCREVRLRGSPQPLRAA